MDRGQLFASDGIVGYPVLALKNSNPPAYPCDPKRVSLLDRGISVNPIEYVYQLQKAISRNCNTVEQTGGLATQCGCTKMMQNFEVQCIHMQVYVTKLSNGNVTYIKSIQSHCADVCLESISIFCNNF